MRIPSIFAVLVLATPLAGCAGGWRGGAPPGAEPGGASTASAPARAGEPQSADAVTFTWRGEASTVHLAGEFNDWSASADPLVRDAAGLWRITRRLPPGRHAYKFVVDGTNWREDPAATEFVDDGYGGRNSVIVVGSGVPAAARAPAAPPAAGSATTGRAPEITADGVRFFFPGTYRSVYLAGDFNGWSTTADPLAVGADGLWTVLKPLAPGVYAYKFVVDGSTWKQDEANDQSVDDGFGGKNSVVNVP